MDSTPIFRSRDAAMQTALHIGVEIRYEENDAACLLHILRFFEVYAEDHYSEFRLIPEVTHNGRIIDRTALLQQFEKIPEDNMKIRGVIGIHFLDEMRPIFDVYMEVLRQVKRDSIKEHSWDETHPLFYLADSFEFIASRFFPERNAMN